jgi:histidinol dehydrogenase
MLRTIDLRGTRPSDSELLALVPRAATDVAAALEPARALIDDVRARGEAALLDQAERFDGVRPGAVRVRAAELAEARDALRPDVRRAIESTIDRVRAASAAQVPAPERTVLATGAVVEQRWQPVGRVGLYVPGG